VFSPHDGVVLTRASSMGRHAEGDPHEQAPALAASRVGYRDGGAVIRAGAATTGSAATSRLRSRNSSASSPRTMAANHSPTAFSGRPRAIKRREVTLFMTGPLESGLGLLIG
jgi:hypothetical protein